jgi:hypothetical protein
VIAEDELYGIEVFHFLQQASEPENQIIGKTIQPITKKLNVYKL